MWRDIMKKKFILFSLFVCILLTGCTMIGEKSMQELIKEGTDRSAIVYNTYRKGYKYNLPRGLTVLDSTEYNEVIADDKYTYYLYVDAVSYYNKVIDKYVETDKAHTSIQISFEDKYGYLEINEIVDDKYFIEIMYNYAKIEVIVRDVDAKVIVSNALSILASIDFNNDILKKLLDEEIAHFSESEIDIFETVSSTDSQYLEAVQQDKEEKEDVIYDSDYIN
jgi:hypothetical protein